MSERLPSEALAWEALEDVKDPEIPVVSLVEMGIVRSLDVDGGEVRVTITPTFAACPAMHVMRQDVERRLRQLGFEHVEVITSLAPAWSSDWITEAARKKLKAFGLAPPPEHGGSISIELLESTDCPYCGSADTDMKNPFGPTLCRVIWYCNGCEQPFEQFKPI